MKSISQRIILTFCYITKCQKLSTLTLNSTTELRNLFVEVKMPKFRIFCVRWEVSFQSWEVSFYGRVYIKFCFVLNPDDGSVCDFRLNVYVRIQNGCSPCAYHGGGRLLTCAERILKFIKLLWYPCIEDVSSPELAPCGCTLDEYSRWWTYCQDGDMCIIICEMDCMQCRRSKQQRSSQGRHSV